MAGSLLLWTWVLGVWAVAAAVWCARRLPPLTGVVQVVLAAVLAVLASLLVWTTPPFARLDLPAIDGAGLTPVRRHPAMLYHPLLLCTGQVGLRHDVLATLESVYDEDPASVSEAMIASPQHGDARLLLRPSGGARTSARAGIRGHLILVRGSTTPSGRWGGWPVAA